MQRSFQIELFVEHFYFMRKSDKQKHSKPTKKLDFYCKGRESKKPYNIDQWRIHTPKE